MKIEIDFSRPDELRKMKRELEMALSTIDGALVAISKSGNDPKQPPLPQIQQDTNGGASEVRIGILQSGSPLARLIDGMPNEFTMTNIFDAAENAGFSRARVRGAVNELVQNEWLILVEPGSGRRPSRFRKA